MLKRVSMYRYVGWNMVRHFSGKARNPLKVGVLGVPFEKGQPMEGVEEGPDSIRSTGILNDLELLGYQVKDYGNVSYKTMHLEEKFESMKNLEHIAACTKEVSKLVQSIMKDGQQCLTLGGDHSIVIGSIDGHVTSLKSDDDIAVLWVDAHADLNTHTSSPSGNIHGMPLALLVKELADLWPDIPGMEWQKQRLHMKNIAYIGLRSVDPYEKHIIDKFGVSAFGMHDIEKYGIVEVTERALEAINPDRHRSLHVSYDIDSLDSLEAPSTGTSVRGGLTLREGISILEMVHKTNTLGALDLTEVNPNIGSPEDVRKTLEAANHLIKAAFGHSRKGSAPPRKH